MNLDFIYTVASYLAIFIILVIVAEVYTKGFILKYIRVKSSRGKKVLVRVLGEVTDYLEVGVIAEGTVTYRDRTVKTKKAQKIVTLPKNAITRLLGVNWVAIDETLNAVLTADFKGVSGYDAERINNLLLRALYRPPLTDPKQQLILIGIILIIVGLFVIYIKLNNLAELINSLNTVAGSTI